MFTQLLAHLNWLHILVAAIVYFALGALWYSKVLFVSPWLKGHGFPPEPTDEAKKGLARIMITSFVLMFLTTVGIAILQRLMPMYGSSCVHAIKYGLLLGSLFSFTTISVGYLYTQKPLSLHLIDGCYHITGIVLASIILAVWK
jgi:hypothetical protein